MPGTDRATRPAEPPPTDVGAIYRAHGQTVARWAARLAGPTLDAADLTQEVFLTAQRLLPGFRGEAAITTWLYRITFNVVRYRRRRERVYRWLHVAAEVPGCEAAAAKGKTPHEELESRRSRDLIYQALDGLGDRYRTVLILFELEGMSGEEIARMTGVPAATLRGRLHRGRAMLAEKLKKLEERQARAERRPLEASNEA